MFGVNQTINAANLLMFKASKAAASLSPEALGIFTDRIIEGHLGQGLDLHWTFHTKVPSEEEYFAMVDGSKKSPHPNITSSANSSGKKPVAYLSFWPS